MQAEQKKKKFSLLDYVLPAHQGNIIARDITPTQQLLGCICGSKDIKEQRLLRCQRCGSGTHMCLQRQCNRGDKFECAPCLNLKMDPLFQVRKVLVQSYFTINNIFQTTNQVNFIFFLTYDDLGYPVQVRGLKLKHIKLSWPMVGCFFINPQKGKTQSQPFYELRPLMVNSNRKGRKEDYITIPKQSLKQGKNVLKFKIYCLDKKGPFSSKYQCQEKGTFYFSINSISKILPQELLAETFRLRRTEKEESLRLLNNASNEIEVTKNKVTLTCPYTRERIRVPIRGKYCKHFTCVCLQTVIVHHQRLRLWTCPICDFLLNEPYVDIFLYSILRDNNNSDEEVIVQQDGRYEWVKSPQEAIDIDDSFNDQPPSKNPQTSQPEIQLPLMLPLDSQNVVNEQREEEARQAALQQEKQRAKKKTIQMIRASIKEKLASPPIARKALQNAKEDKDPVKNKIKQTPAKPRAVLPEVKILQCTEIHHKGYFFKNFCSKSEAGRGKSELAKHHWQSIKSYGELKNIFLQIK